jgi:hypothetical protein
MRNLKNALNKINAKTHPEPEPEPKEGAYCKKTCSELGEHFPYFDLGIVNMIVAFWKSEDIAAGCVLMQFDYDEDGIIGVGDLMYAIGHWMEPWWPACAKHS